PWSRSPRYLGSQGSALGSSETVHWRLYAMVKPRRRCDETGPRKIRYYKFLRNPQKCGVLLFFGLFRATYVTIVAVSELLLKKFSSLCCTSPFSCVDGLP